MKRQQKQQQSKKDATCFATCAEYNMLCQDSACRHWLNTKEYNNCVLLAAEDGPKTLQQIGDMFGVTRMRICQIEKIIFKKIAKRANSMKII